MDKKRYEATTNDEYVAREEAYFKDIVLDYINHIEDRTEDGRLDKASEKEIDELAERVTNKILTDPEVWNTIRDSITYYVYNDQTLINAKKED